MTQNKFWLVWCEAGNAPKKRHNTEESAYKEAHKLASMYPQHEYVVLPAVRSFKAVVNVVETDLTVPQVDTTATKSKFKVGDFVEYNKYKYEVTGVLFPSDNDYPDAFAGGVAYKCKDTDTGRDSWLIESVLCPWEDESPKHDFKVGDLVEFESENLLKDTGTVIEVEDSHIAVQRKKCVSYFYDDEGVKLLRKL